MSIRINVNIGYDVIKNISLVNLNKYIISQNLLEVWSGAGDGEINFLEDNKLKYGILIGAGENFRTLILQCYEAETKETWYPINDIKFIDRAKEYSDECYAPEGCFLSPEDTWIVLKDFYLTGERSKNFKWIKSSELPPFKNMDDYFNVTKTY